MTYYESALFIVMNKTLLSMVIINYICHQKRNLGGVLRGSYLRDFYEYVFIAIAQVTSNFNTNCQPWLMNTHSYQKFRLNINNV